MPTASAPKYLEIIILYINDKNLVATENTVTSAKDFSIVCLMIILLL